MDLNKYKPNKEFLLYKTDSGEVKVDVLVTKQNHLDATKKYCRTF
jgi:hypothetical protein